MSDEHLRPYFLTIHCKIELQEMHPTPEGMQKIAEVNEMIENALRGVGCYNIDAQVELEERPE